MLTDYRSGATQLVDLEIDPTPDRSQASGWEITRCPLTVLIGVGRRDATGVADPPIEPALAHCGCPLTLTSATIRSDRRDLATGVRLQWHRSTLVDLRTVERRREAGHNRP